MPLLNPMNVTPLTRRRAIASVAALLVTSPVLAKARPFLTITGRTRSGADEAWTEADVEALGLDAVETTTPWHAAVRRYEGVRLSRILAAAGAAGVTAARLHALNDYTVVIPPEDLRLYDPLLAVRRDGEDMPVSDKGPCFLVYDFDRHPELDNPTFRARSIWQVDAADLR